MIDLIVFNIKIGGRHREGGRGLTAHSGSIIPKEMTNVHVDSEVLFKKRGSI